MTRARWMQENRMRRFEDLYERWSGGRLSQCDAAEILGLSERTFRRYVRRFEAEGLEGLNDRRLDRANARAAPVDEIGWMLEEYRTRYTGWTVKHFHDELVRRYDFPWSYTWTKSHLHNVGLVRKSKQRGAHRRKRPRRPCIGMMLHQDGSSHEWLAGLPSLDLIATMDDADSHVYSAFLVPEEGTQSSFLGLMDVIGAHGLPCSFYTDRGSHYFHTPEAGGKVDKTRLTQVGRALHQLGIEHIPAYSPEARGRSERLFRTLQDRLVKELAFHGIQTVEAANAYINDVYLPDHNARFAVQPEQTESAFVPVHRTQVENILCIQETRTVAKDNTVRYKNLTLQLPAVPWRAHFVKAKVRVHDYPGGTLAIFTGPRRIASYTPSGDLIIEMKKRAA